MDAPQEERPQQEWATSAVAMCDATVVRRIAAMLDLEVEPFAEGETLPRGWHFFLLGGETRRGALRPDGFPGFGVPMPDLGLPRLLLAGRTIAIIGDLRVGARIHRQSRVQSITHKQGVTGPLALMTIEHQLRTDHADTPAIRETQTYVLLGAASAKPSAKAVPVTAPIGAAHSRTVQPDETLLFQYSALGFNSHNIHLDRTWARDVEGLPDLVVNGGLAGLLLTEFLRTELGITPAEIKTRHTAPLYCGRPITLTAVRDGDRWHARAYDDAHVLAVDMEVVAS